MADYFHPYLYFSHFKGMDQCTSEIVCEEKKVNRPLNAGAIAGIVIGVIGFIVTVACIVLGLMYCCCRA